MIAATVRGSRKGPDKLCEDFALTAPLPDGRMLLVVCDGVGSVPRARAGARLAALTALDLALTGRTIVTQADCAHLVEDTAETWSATIQELGAEPNDCDTTLLIAVVERGKALISGIGDGFAAAAYDTRDGMEYELVFAQQRPLGGAENATFSLAWPGGGETRSREIVDDRLVALLLSTDGLEEVAVARSGYGEHEQHLHPGVVDRLLLLARKRTIGEREQVEEMLRKDIGVMASKGDDLGLALVAW